MMNFEIYGEHDPGTINQFHETRKYGSAIKSLLLPDGHKGFRHPVGCVIAYKEHLSLSGVGPDIGCGTDARRIEGLKWSAIASQAAIIADNIAANVAFGTGKTGNSKPPRDLFSRDYLNGAWQLESTKPLYDLAMAQFGTVGGGNHFVDVFSDEHDDVWVGVHFGSRGLGYKITKWFLNALGVHDSADGPPHLIEINSDLGRQYWLAMQLATQYAEYNREQVLRQVISIIDPRSTVNYVVGEHHNAIWEETIDGEEAYVVRKGATPAFPGDKLFIGGTMGTNSYILEAINAPLNSTIHGAGRVMGRNAAKKQFTWEQAREATKGVEVRGGELDESPMCYKDIDTVLGHIDGHVKKLFTLQPRIVLMAGKNDVDPYKD